jgi:hypothetical protein
MIWHFWLAVILVITCVFAVAALAIGYVVKTQVPKHPKQPNRR